MSSPPTKHEGRVKAGVANSTPPGYLREIDESRMAARRKFCSQAIAKVAKEKVKTGEPNQSAGPFWLRPRISDFSFFGNNSTTFGPLIKSGVPSSFGCT